MKKIQFLLTLVFTLGTLLNTGCKKDWLDQKPDKNLTIPTMLSDYQALLDNSSLNYSALSIGEIASDGHTLRSDYLQYLGDTEFNAYTWSNDRAYLKLLDWNQSYKVILTANLILDGLKKIIPDNNSDQAQWKQIKGNALFVRSRLFYEIAQIWSSAYDHEKADKDLGIPIRLEADITIPSLRSTISGTYTQIISDLKSAADLLPDISNYKTRASKVAVYAQLAKTYLVMQEYQRANEFANACLEIDDKLLDFNTLPENSDYIGINNDEVIYHAQGIAYLPVSFAYIDQSLYNLYDENDLRRKVYFFINPEKTISFKGNYNSGNTIPFFGLAIDEMYLIRAECYARIGNTELAMKDLNTLLKSRWSNKVTFPTFTADDAEDALDQILTERRKELILRGTRWTDLKRLNLDPRHAITLTREAGDKKYILEPNSYKYTFPIPNDVIQLSGIQQNEGWEK